MDDDLAIHRDLRQDGFFTVFASCQYVILGRFDLRLGNTQCAFKRADFPFMRITHIQDDVFVTYSRHTGLAGGVVSEDPEARQIVIGSNGNDTLIGGPQGDYLFAGTGKQTMTGNGGADRFVFDFGSTKAKITDFDPGTDLLVFENAGRLNFGDVKISGYHGNTLVQVGDDRIELTGVRPHELTKHDFLFDV